MLDTTNGRHDSGKPMPRVVFSYAGGSDVGEISDRAARILHGCRLARMLCLAGISGQVDEVAAESRAADTLLMIDGCSNECGKKTFEREGFDRFVHLSLADLSCKKGRTPVTDERVMMVARQARRLLDA